MKGTVAPPIHFNMKKIHTVVQALHNIEIGYSRGPFFLPAMLIRQTDAHNLSSEPKLSSITIIQKVGDDSLHGRHGCMPRQLTV
jgi:hypothetical protein